VGLHQHCKEVGDENHLKVRYRKAAERSLADHDPEGVAFEYPVTRYVHPFTDDEARR